MIDPQLLMFYKETHIQEPIEKTGFDGNLWKWEYPDYNKSYMVVADVARGDSTDYSACHVFDVEQASQVACLLYTSPSPRDLSTSRMPSSA